jgi:hypothetical protein
MFNSLLLSVALYPLHVCGDFIHEDDFWEAIDKEDYASGDRILQALSTSERYSYRDGMQLHLMKIALEAHKHDVIATKLYIDFAMSYWDFVP